MAREEDVAADAGAPFFKGFMEDVATSTRASAEGIRKDWRENFMRLDWTHLILAGGLLIASINSASEVSTSTSGRLLAAAILSSALSLALGAYQIVRWQRHLISRVEGESILSMAATLAAHGHEETSVKLMAEAHKPLRKMTSTRWMNGVRQGKVILAIVALGLYAWFGMDVALSMVSSGENPPGP